MQDKTGQPLPPDFAHAALQRVREAVRGNGIKADAVTMEKLEGAIYSIEAVTTLIPRIRTIEKIIPGKKTSMEKADGPQGVRDSIERERLRILASPDIGNRVRQAVLERKDQGFGLRNEIIKLPFLTKEYVYYHPCKNCGAQGQIKCQRCTGRGYESCPKCYGQGMETCHQCGGSQIITINQGRQPCPTCNGQGRISCRTCNQSRKIPCPACRAKGVMVCQHCNGNAWNSYVTTAEIDVAATFAVQTEEGPEAQQKLPGKIAAMVETLGRKLPDYAYISYPPPAVPEAGAGSIMLPYHLDLPYAEAEFALGKRHSLPLTILGRDGAIGAAPAFLEKLMEKGMRTLAEAGQGRGDVAGKIREAGRYRTIRHAIIAAAKYSNRKAAGLLAKHTPLGLSPASVRILVVDADRALKSITRKPRRQGALAGSALAGALYAGWFLSPLRGIAAGLVPDPLLQPAFDAVVFAAGIFAALMAIRLMAAGAMDKALKGLLPPGQKSRIMPKAGRESLWTGLVCAVLFAALTEATLHTGAPVPAWYVSLRGLLLR